MLTFILHLFLPRFLSNLISKIKLGRPYVNYLYSFNSLKKLLIKSGFSEVDLYTAYPHYHSPLFILPYNSSLKSRRRFWHSKKCVMEIKGIINFLIFLSFNYRCWKKMISIVRNCLHLSDVYLIEENDSNGNVLSYKQ